MMEKPTREIWVDNVKVIACVLVVSGHFYTSMVASNILPDSDLFQWFKQTVYYFHVYLFFICSGYLYQKLNRINDVHSWWKNILKKALCLGVPYFTFSIATWLLKTIFSSSVNTEIGGLFDTLFLHPTAPYWYLYALFFLFLITPTFQNKKKAIMGLAVAIAFKFIWIFEGGYGVRVISYVLSNEIWFVIGMCLNILNIFEKKYSRKKNLVLPSAIGVLFLLLSILIYVNSIENEIISFLMGILACSSVVMIIKNIFDNRRQSAVFGVLAKYTMPIFLMHTIFAASVRTVLFKLEIQDAAIHIVLGIAISFIGPMIAAIIMKKTKWLEFFLYPGKFIKIK